MKRGAIPLIVLIIGIITAILAALGLTQNQASPRPSPVSWRATAGTATPLQKALLILGLNIQ